MAQMAVIAVNQNGDIGGTGVSRFHFYGSSGIPTQADLDAAAAALKTMYQAIDLYGPTAVTFSANPSVNVLDSVSGLIMQEMTLTTPWTSAGAGSGTYAGGVGARMYWHTNTVAGRRILRGATYMTPLVAAAFASNGALNVGVANTIANAGKAWVTAMFAANLTPVIWHRPAKGAISGGLTGPISTCTVSVNPCSVRSRRQ